MEQQDKDRIADWKDELNNLLVFVSVVTLVKRELFSNELPLRQVYSQRL